MKASLALAAAVVALHALAAHAASVDGVDVHWTAHGAGPRTIVFVHGWTADGSVWSEQVPVLSRNHRVIVLDLPGHGRSGMPAAFSIELFARAVEAVRREAKAERVVLAGHSVGALVVRKYALMYPGRVSALVLVDGQVQIDDGRSGGPPRTIVGAAAREQTIRMGFSGMTSAALQERLLRMMLGAPEATATGTLLAMQDRSQRSNDPVRVPVLAVYAGTKLLATERAVKVLYPRAEYHRIPETGHFLMMEAPEAFNRLVEGFLARLGG